MVERQVKKKSKSFERDEKTPPRSGSAGSPEGNSATKFVIIACLPMPPHVPFFISGDIGKLFGYEPEDIIGNTKFWINTVHLSDIPQLFTGFYHMFIRGSHVHEYRFLCKDGRYKRILVQIFMQRQHKGKPATVMACLRESIMDTWERTSDGKQIEITIDSKTRVRSINPRVEEVLGYVPKKIIGKSLLDFIPPDYRFTSIDVHSKIINQSHDFVLFWNAITHKDGSLRFLMHECTGHFDDHRERIIKTRSRNISSRVVVDTTTRLHCEKQLLSSLSRGAADEQQRPGGDPLEKLSGREREILYLTVEGFSSTRIGERLSISSRTVEAHRANLMRKLNAKSINQLVRYMVHHILSSDTA
jgi:PAS domain S-box-containing protein